LAGKDVYPMYGPTENGVYQDVHGAGHPATQYYYRTGTEKTERGGNSITSGSKLKGADSSLLDHRKAGKRT